MEGCRSRWQHLQIRMSVGDLQHQPLQVEQPLVKNMSKDHERMIRGCFANGTDSYQTKRCDIFNGKNIYRKGNFFTETLWLDGKSYFWYYSKQLVFFNTSSSCALTNLRIFKIETFLIRKFAKNRREVSKSWEILLWLRLGEDKDLSGQGILI